MAPINRILVSSVSCVHETDENEGEGEFLNYYNFSKGWDCKGVPYFEYKIYINIKCIRRLFCCLWRGMQAS